MNDASRALEALTPEQVAAYRRDGYLVLEGRVSPEVIAACHAEIARLKDSARGLTGHTEALDLERPRRDEGGRLDGRAATRQETAMTETNDVTALVDRYIAMWNETDPAR
ncbi:MAG: phytanoyl-CoA dioxygenase family protein, partial [Rhizobiales bacterium]|nr:phytanoyl-CoA dioxygenase family protein [Hyphomicrobiales bacterium]